MNVSMSVLKSGTTIKTVVASLLFLSSMSLVGCGRNSSANPNYGPAPTGVRGAGVVTRGTYVEGRYVEGGAGGGAYGGEGGGATCSIQNLDAAIVECRIPARQARVVKRALSQSADQQGLISSDVLPELRLGRRTTQCVGTLLCGDARGAGGREQEEDVQDDSQIEDIKPVPENTIRRKY